MLLVTKAATSTKLQVLPVLGRIIEDRISQGMVVRLLALTAFESFLSSKHFTDLLAKILEASTPSVKAFGFSTGRLH